MIEFKENVKYFLKNKIFISALIIVTILSYGFAITHMSIGVDDLCLDRYVTDTYILSANRWGTWLTYNILGITEYTPFWLELVTTLIYMATAILCSAIIKTMVKDKISNIAYIIFSCMYISFPVLFYPFTYQPTNITVALSNLILILMAYLVYKNYFENKRLEYYGVYALISSFAIAMYESCVQTYIVFVLIIMLLHIKYVDKKIKFVEILKLGLLYIIELLIGIIAYIAIAFIVKTYLRLNNSLVENFAYSQIESSIQHILFKFESIRFFEKTDLFLGLFKYFRIIFICIIIYETIKNKDYKYIFLSSLLILSNFIFFIAFEAVLFRLYYSWAVFVGFSAMYIFESLKNIQIKNIDKILVIIFAFFIIFQTRYMNQKFYEDNRIAEMSKNTATVIADTIVSQCKDYQNKPLIYLNVECRENYDYNTDVLFWGYSSFFEKGKEITKYINHFGYNFKNASKFIYKNSQEYVSDYSNRVQHNNYVSEGEKYIYITINY